VCLIGREIRYIPTFDLTVSNEDTASDNLSMTDTSEMKLRKKRRLLQLASFKLI
jgi:hypothetical protein